MKKYLILLPLITSCNGLGRSGMSEKKIDEKKIDEHGESEITNKKKDMDACLFSQSAIKITSDFLKVSKNDLKHYMIIDNASAIQKELPRRKGEKYICHSFEEKFFEAVMKDVPCQEGEYYCDNLRDFLGAITSGSIPLVKALFKLYSDIYTKYVNVKFQDFRLGQDVPRIRVLHYSVIKEYIEIVTILLENRANVNLGDDLGNTALHYAVALDNKEKALKMVEILLKAGANIKENRANKTPIDIAESLGRQEIVDLLKKELAKLK